VGFTIKCEADEHTIITVLVDEMVTTASHLSHIHRFNTELRNFFKISNLRELKWLLGLKVDVQSGRTTITLSQKAYVDTILECFNLRVANSAPTPMDAGTVLSDGQAPATVAHAKCPVPEGHRLTDVCDY
jgi:hypothetical protein